MLTNHQLSEFASAVRESTIKRLKMVPNGYENWKAGDGYLMISQIASHLIACDHKLIEGIKTGISNKGFPDPEMEPLKDRAEYNTLVAGLSSVLKTKIEVINSLDENYFNNIITAELKDGIQKVPVWWSILRLNIDHEIHHRGQLALYLKMINEKK